MDERSRAVTRYELYNKLIAAPRDAELPGLDDLSKIVLKEVLIQPLATSWWVARNLKEKHGIEMGLERLTGIYQDIQLNKLAQDMIRFNSVGGKAIALARGITLKPKTTMQYFDIQTTDKCPCTCLKCWNVYEDDNGSRRLLKRKVERQDLPSTEDFKRVAKEAIDMGIDRMTSTGGGEPFMNRDLPEILAFAKDYSRSVGRDLKTFVPTCGLGTVYKDKGLLRKAVENIDLLRFSFDSLDEEFLMRSHGVNRAGYQRMIGNLQKVVELKKEHGLGTDIEILILIYGQNHSSIYRTIKKAKELGANRILLNSLTGKEDTLKVSAEEMKEASKVLGSVFQRYSLGEYGDLKLDFDPVLMNSLESLQKEDADNLEPTIGNLRYCMKNVFGLTPVVTADGTFHVCFPCSQPFQANIKDIFKIGNIMDNSVQELVDLMRSKYREVDPKKDCISDCRDIPYFNAILRKVIDDHLAGIQPITQPFLDRTAQTDAFVHSMHNEKFDARDLDTVMEEYEKAAQTVKKDQQAEFAHFAAEKSADSGYFQSIPQDISYELLSRYDLNLFSAGCIRKDSHVLIFSPELRLGLPYEITECGLVPSETDAFKEFVTALDSPDRLVFSYDIPKKGQEGR